jgi:hypothetical protein
VPEPCIARGVPIKFVQAFPGSIFLPQRSREPLNQFPSAKTDDNTGLLKRILLNKSSVKCNFHRSDIATLTVSLARL